MKNFKRVIIWALLSLSLQAGGLYFLERMYFKHSSDFKVEKVEAKPVEANVTLPNNIEDVKVSYSGRYISYFNNDKLYAINTKNGEENEITIEDSNEILYADWIENVNRIILVVRDINDRVQLYTYDISSKTEHKIKELGKYSNSMKINGLEVSSKTGVKYIALTWGSSRPTIYRIDINETLTKVSHNIKKLGEITAFQNKDILICEDELRNSFYSYTNGKSKKLSLNISGKVDVLGTDSNDNIYFGEYEGDKIYRIVYGSLDTKEGEWQSLALDESKNKEDIHITGNGEILINDNLKGMVLNKTTGETISYKGKFVSMNDKIIYSNKEGYIYIKDIKDVNNATEV